MEEPGILVGGLDALATTVLQRAGDAIADTAEEVLGRRRTRVLAQARGEVWRDVLAVAGDELPPQLSSADFLAAEYELVILPQRITRLDAYLRVRRPGRGVALDRATRAKVWKAIETYRDRAVSLDITTFPERLALAAAWLDRRAAAGAGRLFDHVIVDEAQDLSPAHLQLLRALVEEGPNDIFLAEDSHQRIYGKKLTLSHYGIQVRGRSRRLTRNYRTTRQNLDAAFRILDPGSYEDMEGQPEEHRYLSPRSGPQPQLLPAADRAEELDRAAVLLRRWLEEDEGLTEAAPETIAVLVRERNQRDAVVNGLAGRNLEVRAVDREAAGRGRPVVMTMHRAKGLEFRKVPRCCSSTSRPHPSPAACATSPTPRPTVPTPSCASAPCSTWPPRAPETNWRSPGVGRPAPCWRSWRPKAPRDLLEWAGQPPAGGAGAPKRLTPGGAPRPPAPPSSSRTSALDLVPSTYEIEGEGTRRRALGQADRSPCRAGARLTGSRRAAPRDCEGTDLPG